jgi:hypothetical protein
MGIIIYHQPYRMQNDLFMRTICLLSQLFITLNYKKGKLKEILKIVMQENESKFVIVGSSL